MGAVEGGDGVAEGRKSAAYLAVAAGVHGYLIPLICCLFPRDLEATEPVLKHNAVVGNHLLVERLEGFIEGVCI